MLPAKFQGHRSIGSGGEEFLKFLHMGVAAICSCDQNYLNGFSFLKALEAVYEIWLQSP